MLANLARTISDFTESRAYVRLLHSKLGLTVSSLFLGLLATLGFAPYHFWVVTIASLAFELCLIASFKTKKQVFFSLLIYFTALNSITLDWLNFVMSGFGGLPLPLSILVEVLFAAYLAIFHAILGTVAFRFAQRKLSPDEIKAYLDNTIKATTVLTPAAAATAAAATATAHATTNTNMDGNVDIAVDDDDNDDEEGDDLPQRGVAVLKHKPTATNSTAKAESKERAADIDSDADEREEQLENVRPMLPGGMPGMFTHNLRMPVLTDKRGVQRRLYKNVFLLCFLPLALIVADFIIGVLFTGFPWMYLGYIAVEGPFSGYAPLVGVRGVTLILFVCAGAIALAIERRFIYLPIAAILFLGGIFTLGVRYTTDLPTIKIAGVQGNIPQEIKWNSQHTMPTIEKYLNLTMEHFGSSDLIIWPESALPVFIQQVQPLISDLNIHAYATNTPILLGIQRLVSIPINPVPEADHGVTAAASKDDTPAMLIESSDAIIVDNNNQGTVSKEAPAQSSDIATTTNGAETATATATAVAATTATAIENSTAPSTASGEATATAKPPKQRYMRYSFNSIYLLGQSEDGSLVQHYDKRQLVPFGEVVPFEDYTRELGSIFNFPMSSFTHGAAKQEQMYLREHDLHFIPAICYESIFPELMISLHDEHTNGILMVSNDSWFGNTRGPDEHLAIARMRSLEMQKPMIRITNSGITAYIDEMGQVVETLPRNTEGVLVVDFKPTQGSTIFVKLGNLILYIAMVLMVLIGLFFRSQPEDMQEQQFQELLRP